MRWLSRPERREIFLVVFSITVYLFAYNFETSLSYVGLDAAIAQGALLRHLGLGNTKVIGGDGLKPPGWRDPLELEIYGSWGWDEGHVAGDGAERSQGKGSGRHGAQWTRRDTIDVLRKHQGDITINNALVRWGNEVPATKVVKHVPGYTILDNVFLYNGSVYLVGAENDLPPMRSMVYEGSNGFHLWETLSPGEAHKLFGEYGGLIRGVSFMTANYPSNNMTLFNLWRLYSTLDPTIDSQGKTTLPPPQRFVFPHNRFFTDANPPFDQHWIRRARFDTSFHPYLLKAAFPHMELQFYEDWEDYHKMLVPFYYERLVIEDRQSAAVSLQKGQPFNTPVFSLETSKWWWEPIRRTMALYFDRLLEEVEEAEANKVLLRLKGKHKKIITLLDNQLEGRKNGEAILVPEDYDVMTRALRRIAREHGYEFHIVSTNLNETSWDTRMDTVVRSTVILGAHGNHLVDAIWMRPSSQSTLVELFSKTEFVLNREVAMRSIGHRYRAWRENEMFWGEGLPTATEETNDAVHVDGNAIAEAIHQLLAREEN